MGILKSIAGIFFPERCVLCDKPVPTGALCCPRCDAGAIKAGAPSRTLELCCPSLAPFAYREPVRTAILRMKMRGDFRAGEYFAGRMTKLLREQYPDIPFDAVTYVPMQKDREAERGYNQAQVLAEYISRELQLPVAGLLYRDGTFTQHHLSATFRRKAAAISFFALPGMSLQGQRLLLVDDVTTTGSTAVACVSALRQIGAGHVVVLAAAR